MTNYNYNRIDLEDENYAVTENNDTPSDPEVTCNDAVDHAIARTKLDTKHDRREEQRIKKENARQVNYNIADKNIDTHVTFEDEIDQEMNDVLDEPEI